MQEHGEGERKKKKKGENGRRRETKKQGKHLRAVSRTRQENCCRKKKPREKKQVYAMGT
jgi:hypothetical protein